MPGSRADDGNTSLRGARFARRITGSPATIAAITFLLAASVTVLRWNAGGRDWSRFVFAGQRFVDPRTTPVPIFTRSQLGYDGQFFARLAFEPFTTEQTAHGIFLDSPAWRQQRILYPLLVWVLSGGRADHALVWLVVVNVIAITAAAAALARFARDAGLSAAWGLFPGLAVGLIMALSYDLAEPLEFALMAWAIVSCRTRRMACCALFLTLAMLTREPAMLGSACLGAVVLWRLAVRRERDWRLLLTPLAPLLVFVPWQLYLHAVWGVWPSQAGHVDFGAPLLGFWRSVTMHWPRQNGLRLTLGAMTLSWHLWVGVEVAVSMRRLRLAALKGDLCLAWCVSAWLAWTALACLFAPDIWNNDWGYARILLEWSLFGFSAMLLAGRPPSRYLCAYTVSVAIPTIMRVVLWV